LRWLELTLLVLALVGPAHGQDIVDVLRHSQQTRLEALKPAQPGPRADTVRRTFDALRARIAPEVPVDLQVIAGGTVAETLHGHIIVASEALADLPEGERLFVLAHELGHVVHNHWLKMGLLYKRWVPGAVTPETTNPVSGPMSREASQLAHAQEHEADTFALQVLGRMGHPTDDAFSAFLHLGMQHDTATHPGTRKRVASLRAALLAVPMGAAAPAAVAPK
jgi:Zn-dependent protease with chaperone function